jgi:hypothetical protein
MSPRRLECRAGNRMDEPAIRADVERFYSRIYVAGYQSLDPDLWSQAFSPPCILCIQASPDVMGILNDRTVLLRTASDVRAECAAMIGDAKRMGYVSSRIADLEVRVHTANSATVFAAVVRLRSDRSVIGEAFGSYHVRRADGRWGVISVIGYGPAA